MTIARGFILSVLIGVHLWLLPACKREVTEPVIGTAYVSTSTVNLRDRLGATQTAVGAVRFGEKVQILERRRRWIRVRTASGREGWLEQRHLVGEDVLKQFEALRVQATQLPSQGQAHARRELNLHVTPDRKAQVYYQLQEGETCEIVARRTSERPPISGQEGAVKFDDWYLVHAGQKSGWGLAANLDMAVPDEVLQYAERKRVTAWFVLDPGPAVDGENKPSILWATAPDENGLKHDFEGIRLFTWGSRRKQYETSFIEGGLRGYYPIVIERGNGLSFYFTAEGRQGERITRRFEVQGNRVRRLPVL